MTITDLRPSATDTADEARPAHTAPYLHVTRDGVITDTRRGKVLNHAEGHRYLRVFFTDDTGTYTCRYVHILICEAWHGPRPTPRHEAAHHDDNPRHNHADNLAWKTRQGNADDMVRNGHSLAGTRNRQHKLTDEQVRAMRAEWERPASARPTQIRLAESYGCHQSLVSRVVNGKVWRHI